MALRPNERVALFIDGPNLYHSSKALGFEVDYGALLKFVNKQVNLVRAYYYTSIIEHEEYSPIKPLTDWLSYNGLTTVIKPAKEYVDAAGRTRIKGNMDIELAIDLLELAPKIDHALLFTGDADLRRLVEPKATTGHPEPLPSSCAAQIFVGNVHNDSWGNQVIRKDEQCSPLT